MLFPQLTWCITQVGHDGACWVKELSEAIYAHSDPLSVLEPHQMQEVLKLSVRLQSSGFHFDAYENAFFRLKLDKQLDDTCMRLMRTEQRFTTDQNPLFALPNVFQDADDYFDLLEALTAARVHYLNEALHFDPPLTQHELTSELAAKYHMDYFDSKAVHAYRELMDILTYVPLGFEEVLAKKTEEPTFNQHTA